MIEVHLLCGFWVVVIAIDNPKLALLKIERSEKCLETFVEILEELAKDVYQKSQQHETSEVLIQWLIVHCADCANSNGKNCSFMHHRIFTGKSLGICAW